MILRRQIKKKKKHLAFQLELGKKDIIIAEHLSMLFWFKLDIIFNSLGWNIPVYRNVF